MTRKQGIFIICVAALVAILAGSFTWVAESSAKSPGRHAFFWRQMMGEEGRPLLRQFVFGRMKGRIALAEKLNLTQEQKAQFAELLTKRRSSVAPAMAGIMEKKQALVMEVLAKAPDEKAIRRASADLAKVIENMAILTSGLVQEARSILTPEQLELLGEFRESRREASAALTEHLRRPLHEK